MTNLPTCRHCGGPIHRRWTLGDPESQPWLHLHEADWVDDPHDAEPVES